MSLVVQHIIYLTSIFINREFTLNQVREYFVTKQGAKCLECRRNLKNQIMSL